MVFFIHRCFPIWMSWSFYKCFWITSLWKLSQKRGGTLELWTSMTLICRIIGKATSYFMCWKNLFGTLWCWCRFMFNGFISRNFIRQRWIFILSVIIWRRNKNRKRQWHKCWRWLTRKRRDNRWIRLTFQDIFIKLNNPSNDYFIGVMFNHNLLHLRNVQLKYTFHFYAIRLSSFHQECEPMLHYRRYKCGLHMS